MSTDGYLQPRGASDVAPGVLFADVSITGSIFLLMSSLNRRVENKSFHRRGESFVVIGIGRSRRLRLDFVGALPIAMLKPDRLSISTSFGWSSMAAIS
jgi:hypothetical protein